MQDILLGVEPRNGYDIVREKNPPPPPESYLLTP